MLFVFARQCLSVSIWFFMFLILVSLHFLKILKESCQYFTPPSPVKYTEVWLALLWIKRLIWRDMTIVTKFRRPTQAHVIFFHFSRYFIMIYTFLCRGFTQLLADLFISISVVTELLRLKMRTRACSVAQLCHSASQWTVDCQAPMSIKLSRQQYWSGLSFPKKAFSNSLLLTYRNKIDFCWLKLFWAILLNSWLIQTVGLHIYRFASCIVIRSSNTPLKYFHLFFFLN